MTVDTYVATFHTHFAAMRTCAALKKRPETEARMAPVPRQLSSSCGTCVFYRGEDPCLEAMAPDLEAVYRREGEAFRLVAQGEE